MPCIVKRACSCIYADEIFRSEQFTQFNIFIITHVVAFNLVPCQIQPCRTLFLRADPVLPVITRHIISTGPSNDRYFQLPREFNEIFPESVFVSKTGRGIIDAAIYHSADRFDKSSINVRINCPYFAVRINLY